MRNDLYERCGDDKSMMQSVCDDDCIICVMTSVRMWCSPNAREDHLIESSDEYLNLMQFFRVC